MNNKLAQQLLFLVPYVAPITLGIGLVAFHRHYIISSILILTIILFLTLGNNYIDNVTVKLATMNLAAISLCVPAFTLLTLYVFWLPYVLYFGCSLGIKNASRIWADDSIVLYVGNFTAGRSLDYLKKCGITHIVELCDSDTKRNPHNPELAHLQICFQDRSSSLLSSIEQQVFHFLDSANPRSVVLVHLLRRR